MVVRNWLLLITTVLFLCCGQLDNKKESNNDYGGISFNLLWVDKDLYKSAALSCESVGVSTITAKLYNSNHVLVATGGPWNCSAHYGVIYNVPVGNNYWLEIFGHHSSGAIFYSGEASNINVYPNTTVNIGTISMYPYSGNQPPTTNYTPPNPPAGLNVSIQNNNIVVTWNASSGATSYNLYWSTNSSLTKENGNKIVNVTSPYIHTGISKGYTYYYFVTAFNSYGESSPSNMVSINSPSTTFSKVEFVSKIENLKTSDGKNLYPCSVVVDKNNNIFLASSGQIYKFTQTGELITYFGPGGTLWCPDLDYDPNKDIIYAVFASIGQVYVYSTNGFLTKTIGSKLMPTDSYDDSKFNFPTGVAVDNNGNVYVPDDDKIKKFSSTGSFIKSFTGDFSGIMKIAADSSNNIYVIGSTYKYVQKFDSSGNFIKYWGKNSFNNPSGITVDSDGYVYVSDEGANSVKVYTSDGSYVTSFGGYGSSDSQFDSPKDVFVDRQGFIYVADYNNNRVQKFMKE